MTKEDNKMMIINKENVFSKIINFLKKIFGKKEISDIQLENMHSNKNSLNKKDFIKEISFREDTEFDELIEKASKDITFLKTISSKEELVGLYEAIKEKQRFMDRKIELLKNDIKMKKASTGIQ